MNLAFTAKRYDTMGGTEHNLFELSRRLVTRNHEIPVYCSETRRPPEPGKTLHPDPTPPLGHSAG